jgi:hypothetical protein
MVIGLLSCVVPRFSARKLSTQLNFCRRQKRAILTEETEEEEQPTAEEPPTKEEQSAEEEPSAEEELQKSS